MSPPRVDRSTALGNADDTGRFAVKSADDFRIALAVVAADLLVDGKVAALHPGIYDAGNAFEPRRFLAGRRRQVVAQDLTARIEMPGVDDERAVAIVDAGARPGRIGQGSNDRGDALGVDRELDAARRSVEGRHAFANLEIEEVVGVERHRGDVAAGALGDRLGDDLAGSEQAGDAGLGQPCAELIEIENAGDQDQKRGQIEDDDSPRQARKGVDTDEPGDTQKPTHRLTDAAVQRSDVCDWPFFNACRHCGSRPVAPVTPP
jgi:hypothetical protein